jgi:alkylation response protein AidB-like acyl-CoA dehydrogenase
MTTSAPDELLEIRRAVRELCDRFPGEYWRSLEPDRYPEAFVQALTEHGWLAALIPEKYGGAGLGLNAASVILEEVKRGWRQRRPPRRRRLRHPRAACDAQMYTMGTLLRHGSDEQKQRYLPRVAAGELRLQAFGVTEPTVGSDPPASRRARAADLVRYRAASNLRAGTAVRRRGEHGEAPRVGGVAPVSNKLVLAYLGQHVLGLPRSY